MPGTLAWWSGHSCVAVQLRRSIGLEPDSGFVELHVGTFPAGGAFVAPAVGHVQDPPALPSPPPIAVLSGTSPASLGAEGAWGHQGVLYLAESAPTAPGAVEEFELEVRRLYVTDVQRMVTGRQGGMVRVSFVDERALWERGHLDRWRFNAKDDEGDYQPDSLDPRGAPWTLAGIAEYVCGRLFGAPKVTAWPPSWDAEAGEFVFSRWSSAVEALREILRRHPARPALHWNGTVGFRERDDGGSIGYTVGEEDSAAAVNAVALPAWIQDMGGQGHVEGSGYGYPSDFVLVAGGPRVASVAIDCWQPVLLIEGEPVPLDEGLAILLGRPLGVLDDGDLEWLQRFVLRYEEHQARPELTGDALKILKRDAYRLWRLPGAETHNRHLLPLLRRAETTKGTRQSVLVESYRYRFRSFKIGAVGRTITTGETTTSEEQKAQHTARADLRDLRKRIDKEVRGGINVESSALQELTGASEFTGGVNFGSVMEEESLFRRALREVYRAGNVSAPEKGSANEAIKHGLALSKPALLAAAAGADELAAAYMAALRRKLEAEAALDPSQIALEQLKFFEELREIAQKAKNEGVEIDEAAAGKALDALKDLQHKKDEIRKAQEEGRVPGMAEETWPMGVHGVNDPRAPDTTATVEDADLGLVRTQLTGHLKETDVPDGAATSLVPRAVRVTFGTHVGPPRDRAKPTPRNWVTDRPEDIVPPQLKALEDAVRGGSSTTSQIAQLEPQGYYSATFTRSGSTAHQIKLEGLPVGQAHVEQRPELVELIELHGSSNVVGLDAQAAEVAGAVIRQRPGVTTAVRRHYLRPWRVNTDGIVDAVEISLRSGLLGFTTLVVTGGSVAPFADANKTRVRAPRPRELPAARAEETR